MSDMTNLFKGEQNLQFMTRKGMRMKRVVSNAQRLLAMLLALASTAEVIIDEVKGPPIDLAQKRLILLAPMLWPQPSME